MKTRFLPLGIFVVIIGFLFVGLTLNPREVPSPLIGKPAPAFRLARLDDPAKMLGNDDLKGQVWLFNAPAKDSAAGPRTAALMNRSLHRVCSPRFALRRLRSNARYAVQGCF